ncbi:MAG: hypothetical protein OXF63_11685 [Anaerolineaceae bacterium]|nr:hypothetical protein [Anaerolineaceae bacterium]
MNSETVISPLLEKLQDIPFEWDGRKAILELKEANSRWRDMEWIGFYFEYLCSCHLQPPLSFPGPKYENTKFDGYWRIPWDFKAHTSLNPKGKAQHSVIINDQNAVLRAIEEHKAVGLIVAIGQARFNDLDRSFQRWHSQLKGGQSQYELERIERQANSRVRKVSMRIERFCVYEIDDSTVSLLKIHPQGRNSNGRPRPPKFRFDLRDLEPLGEVYVSR